MYRKKNVRKNMLWVYILVKLGSCTNDFQNKTGTSTFFKNGPKLHRRSMAFLRHNFRDIFFYE